jgi:hypothetical protein
MVKKGFKHTEETKQKIGLANRGKKRSEEHKKKISLAQKGKVYRKGAHLTDKTKHILSLQHMGKTTWNKGIPRTEEVKRRLSLAMVGMYKGEKNPNWKGGIAAISNLIRTSVKYTEWRQEVFIRDNFTCQDCGDNSGGNLEVHHKKCFSVLLEEIKKYLPLLPLFEAAMLYTPLWNVGNGLTLCEKCHNKSKYHKKVKYRRLSQWK